MPPELTRAAAVALDAADELGWLRDEFVVDDGGPIYLDGNSLGRLPRRTAAAVARAVRDGWGQRLVRGWAEWSTWPTMVGDRLGALALGARPGETLVCDTTSINLYKLAYAALAARPERARVVADAGNFPSDRYVLEGVCAQLGRELVVLPTGDDDTVDDELLASALTEDTALVVMAHVAYRSGALVDLAAVSAAARAAGAWTLWDLSHSAGAAPVDLAGAGADLAVGCTYKYLNAGPGAPAYLWVRTDLQDRLDQPIHGWWSHADKFAMSAGYARATGIERFLVSTPPVLGLVAVDEGLAVLERAGLDQLRARSLDLTEFLIALCDARLARWGVTVATPRDPGRRGGHVALRHPEALRLSKALIADGLVVPDFRMPDVLRLAPVAAYTSYAEVFDAVEHIEGILRERRYELHSTERERIT